MSNFRVAVIGADQLDPDHHLAINQLSERGLLTAFALDAGADEGGLDILQTAMDSDALDAILIAGDLSQLPTWAIFALQNGWPVYTTHAVPLSIEEMIEIRRAEQISLHSHIQFGLTARHHESVQAAVAKRDTGEYGQLLTLRGVCGCLGADIDHGIVFNPGAQLIDLMQIFAGPFQDVSGFSDFDRSGEPGSETNVMASLRTHSGVLASLHLSASQWRPTFRLELGFERGYMWLEGLNSEHHQFGQEVLVSARTQGASTKHETVDRFDQSHGPKIALEQFLARVKDPATAMHGTSQDAFDTLNTIHRIIAADPIVAIQEERQVS